jgi:hypothetical protein
MTPEACRRWVDVLPMAARSRGSGCLGASVVALGFMGGMAEELPVLRRSSV